MLGRLRTIRVRLTLWYVLLLAVILCAFSAFLCLSLARNLEADLDRSLAAVAFQVLADPDDGNASLGLSDGPTFLPGGTVAALYDVSGQHVLAHNPSQPLPPLPSDAVDGIVHGSPLQRSVRLADGSRWRAYAVLLTDGPNSPAILVVARSEEQIAEALGQLVGLMALAIPAALLLAIGVGSFLAGRTLDPIDRVTRTAAQLNADTLARRLDFQGADDEVGRLAATFDTMLDRLEGAFQRQRQFTADASHELRTPLALVRGQIGVALERRRRPAEYERLLANPDQDTARMSLLLAELLTLARVDAGGDQLERETIALDEVAAQVMEAMRPLAHSRGVALERGVWEVVELHGDQTRLIQLLLNLVENGLNHTAEGGSVTVSVADEGDRAVLRVADTGVGIPPQHLPHVFERFYRIDLARSRTSGGSGLGLAICQWIARAHGGSIEAVSELGRGTTMTVGLPTPAGRPEPATPEARLRVSDSRSAPAGGGAYGAASPAPAARSAGPVRY
ncbi:MAG: HAMP domain-containing protein [Chloroflexi bacterium]|nr:HAMP domain-containing protein [Chloroflexota bacterium]